MRIVSGVSDCDGYAMNLKVLRAALPGWTWTAVRRGFGWAYVGRLGDRMVECIPCAHVGQWEDSSETVWYVYEADTTMMFAHFWLREEESCRA